VIHKIEIENFCSIRDKQVLDLRIAESAPQLEQFRKSNSRVEIRLPTVVGLFGANASGKSTVLRALSSIVLFKLHSFDFEADERIGFFQPFMGVENRNIPTRLAIEFDAAWIGGSQKLYRYELHLENNSEGFSAKRVSREALFYSPEGRMKRLFERTGDQVIVGREFELRPKDSRLQSIRPNSSVLSTLAKLNHPLSIKIWKDLALTQSNTWGYTRAEEISEAKLLESYKNDTALLQKLSRELRRLDTGLEEMVIHESPNGLFAGFLHNGLSSPLFFSQESRGTQHFIEMFPRIVYALTWGHVVLIDELDANLHPLLLPEVFRWFHDTERNPHGAQLLFTAHNAGLMDYLEKEEIYFTEKNREGATELFGATDIEGLRREPSISRKYLGGSLGAVPQVG
jgi:uncharacterized protein